MNTFEKWWDEYYGEKFLSGQPKIMRDAFKEVAKEAWMEAYTLGYQKGVEVTEYDDTK